MMSTSVCVLFFGHKVAGHKDIHSLCSPLNLQLPVFLFSFFCAACRKNMKWTFCWISRIIIIDDDDDDDDDDGYDDDAFFIGYWQDTSN